MPAAISRQEGQAAYETLVREEVKRQKRKQKDKEMRRRFTGAAVALGSVTTRSVVESVFPQIKTVAGGYIPTGIGVALVGSAAFMKKPITKHALDAGVGFLARDFDTLGTKIAGYLPT